MDFNLILVLALFLVVGIIVAIDQRLTDETYTLGSEWDFTKTDFKPKSLDNNK